MEAKNEKATDVLLHHGAIIDTKSKEAFTKNCPEFINKRKLKDFETKIATEILTRVSNIMAIYIFIHVTTTSFSKHDLYSLRI